MRSLLLRRWTAVLLTVSSVFFTVYVTPMNASSANSLRVSMFPADIEFNPLRTYTATEAQIYTAIYEGLVIQDPVTLQPLPGTAREWQTSEDGSELRFYLRENARFSDGRGITADDFVQSFMAHINPDSPSPFSGFLDAVIGARNYRTGNGDKSSVGIKSKGEYELVFELEHPAPYFLDMLAHQSMVLIHPDLLGNESRSGNDGITGNGPYVLVQADSDGLEFEPNPHYWDSARTALDSIFIEYSDNVIEVTEAFNRGEIQWSMGNFNFSALNNPEYLMINPVFSTSFFYFNHRQEAFRSPEVRRGISLLIPWDEVRSEAVHFQPSNQLIPEIPGYGRTDGIETQNIEEGLSLLESAGHPLGEGLPDFIIRIPPGAEQRRIAEIFRSSIVKHLQFNVEIDQFRSGEGYYDRLADTEYTIGSITWIGDYLDPLTFLMLFESDSRINEAAYSNPHFDSLLGLSHSQENRERMKTLAEAESLLLQEGSVWPISHTAAFNLVNTMDLEGWFPTVLDIHPFKFMRRIEFLPGPGIALY
ncbi:peptide ABC transporter substrate-binding protein [Spirochaeta dissipatitropha]